MKMKFKLIALLLVFVMVLPFVVACGNDITLENTPAQDKIPVAGELAPLPDAVEKADVAAKLLEELLEQSKLVSTDKITVKGKYKGTVSSSLLTPSPENIFSSTEWVELDMSVLNSLIGGDISAELKDILIGMVLGGEYEDGDELLAGIMNSVDLEEIEAQFGSIDNYLTAKAASHYFRAVFTAVLYQQYGQEIPEGVLEFVDKKAEQASEFVEAYLTGEADFETFFDFLTMDHPMSDAIDEIKSTWDGTGNINLEVYLEAFKPYIPSIYSNILGVRSATDNAVDAIISSFEQPDGAFANGDFVGVLSTFYAAALAEVISDCVLDNVYSFESDLAYNMTQDCWAVVDEYGIWDIYIPENFVIKNLNTIGYVVGGYEDVVYATYEEACAARDELADDIFDHDVYQLCDTLFSVTDVDYDEACAQVFDIFYELTFGAVMNVELAEDQTVLSTVLASAYVLVATDYANVPFEFVSTYMSTLFGNYMTDGAQDAIDTVIDVLMLGDEEIYAEQLYAVVFGYIYVSEDDTVADKLTNTLVSVLTNEIVAIIMDEYYFDGYYGVTSGLGEIIDIVYNGGILDSVSAPLVAYLLATYANENGIDFDTVYYELDDYFYDYNKDYVTLAEIFSFVYAINKDLENDTDLESFYAAIEVGDAKAYAIADILVNSVEEQLYAKAEYAFGAAGYEATDEEIAQRVEMYSMILQYTVYSILDVPYITEKGYFNYQLAMAQYTLFFDADLDDVKISLVEHTFELARESHTQPYDNYSLADIYSRMLIPTLLADGNFDAEFLSYHLYYLILDPKDGDKYEAEMLQKEATELAVAIKNLYNQKFDEKSDMIEVATAIANLILDRFHPDSALGVFARNLLAIGQIDIEISDDEIYELVLKQFYGENNDYANAVIDLIGTNGPEFIKANLELLFSVGAPNHMGLVDAIMAVYNKDVVALEDALKDYAPAEYDIYVDLLVAILNNDKEALIATLETLTNIDADDVVPGILTFVVHYLGGFGDIDADIATVIEAYEIYGLVTDELENLFGELYPNFEATMDVIVKHLESEVFDPVTFAIDVMVAEGVFDGIAIPSEDDENYYKELISTLVAINVFMNEGLRFYDAKNCANVTILVLSDPDNLSAYAGRLLGAQKVLKAAGSEMWKIFALVSTKAHLELADDSSVNWEDALGYLSELVPGLEIQNYEAFAHILRGNISTVITNANTEIELIYDNALETAFEYTVVASVTIENVIACSLEIVLDVNISKV